MKILILEDHNDWISLYQDILGPAHQLTVLTTLAELEDFQSKGETNLFDVAISDLKLTDGFFLDWIEQKSSLFLEQVPTIIVSSFEDVDILKRCFEWGAFDYLIKPFKVSELSVKVERAHRNYRVKGVDLSLENVLEKLTSMEGRILQLFMKLPHRYMSRDELATMVWKKVNVNPKTIDVHLSNIRRKLELTNWTIESAGRGENAWKLVKKVK